MRIVSAFEVRAGVRPEGSAKPWTAVWIDEIRLANGVEGWEPAGAPFGADPSSVQVELCADCGFQGCGAGGWVALRRVDGDWWWVPPATPRRGDDFLARELSMPHYLRLEGAIVWRPEAWARMRALNPRLPSPEATPPLTAREALRAWRFAAPGRVLGTPEDEDLSVRRNLVFGVPNGSELETLDAIDAAVRAFAASDAPVAATPRSAEDVVLEVLLDLPGLPSWTAFVRTPAGVGLSFGGDYVLRCGPK